MNRRTLAAAALMAALFLPVRSAEALETNELLALVAMPLAVAAVSEVTDVPLNQLVDVVTLLNDANVPPVQFVEVVRYAPVALVIEEPAGPTFVEFVRTRYEQGVVGLPLVTEIEREIRTYGVPDVELDVIPQPTLIVDNDDFLVTREEVRASHPHGGPPGQLKKELGLRTGAEVVHGERKGRSSSRGRVAARVDDDDDNRGRRVAKVKEPKRIKAAKVERDRSERVARAPKVKMEKLEKRGRGGDDHRGHGGRDHGGGGNGKGNGKGKGKG